MLNVCNLGVIFLILRQEELIVLSDQNISDTEKKLMYGTPQQNTEAGPAVATVERQKSQISKLQAENDTVCTCILLNKHKF